MSLGIYKQGQGYWVRVMTAVLIGVATLGCAGWVASQVSVFETKLPRNTWFMGLKNVKGAVAAGEQVSLVGKSLQDGEAAPEIGTAEVSRYDAALQELYLRKVAMKDAGTQPDTAVIVRGGAGGAFEAQMKEKAKGVPLIEPKLLIGLSVGVVLLAGSMLAYYFVGIRRGSVEFLIATDMEMKKVNWSTAREIRGSTIVVIGACMLIAGFLFGVDLLFQWFFRVIGVLVDTGA